MSFEFKVGDVVKIEGVLIRNTDPCYPLRMFISDNVSLSFNKEGRYFSCSIKPELQLVSRPKKKVTKWKWVIADRYDSLIVTDGKYESAGELNSFLVHCTPVQKIDSTAEEFEE